MLFERRRQAREVEMIPPTFVKPATATHEVIEMECAALFRCGMVDPIGLIATCPPDVVYFDPGLERRLDGHRALVEYSDGLRG
jgi:hypothetical protein